MRYHILTKQTDRGRLTNLRKLLENCSRCGIEFDKNHKNRCYDYLDCCIKCCDCPDRDYEGPPSLSQCYVIDIESKTKNS